MAVFTGFKPTGLKKIAGRLGYQGSLDNFENYLEQNPEKKRQMLVYEESAKRMARGGIVRMQEGGTTASRELRPEDFDTVYGGPAPMPSLDEGAFTPPPVTPPPVTPPPEEEKAQTIEDFSIQQAKNPTVPEGGVTKAANIEYDPNQSVSTTDSMIKDDVKVGTTVKGQVAQTGTPDASSAATIDASNASPEVKEAVKSMNAAQGIVSNEAIVNPAQQDESSVSKLKAAQGTATTLQNPVQREIQEGELISGVANAEKAAKFTEQIEAAEALPSEKATVRGQLAELTSDFDGKNPPPWAAGTLRAIQAQMAARGVGASSMAGQALIQGALESALPIAQADASTFARFEEQNLSNRQARALLAAEQRATFLGQEFDQAFQSRVKNAASIADVANMNFTAEQTIALENAKMTETMNIANLENRQAMVMAEAAALSNLDEANLNNRQQAAVQNAKSFLEMDMANLDNEQQTEMFKNEQITQAIFTDTAADNAAKQFNAESENQTNQFYDGLKADVAKHNTEQKNAMERYNAGEENEIAKYNAELKLQKEKFNSENRRIIDQSNAVWRREIATADTEAINRANELNAKAVLDISATAYNNIWQGFRDDIEHSFKSGENAKERAKDITLRKMQDEAEVAAAALVASAQEASDLADGVVALATSNTGASLVSDAVDIAEKAIKWIFG